MPKKKMMSAPTEALLLLLLLLFHHVAAHVQPSANGSVVPTAQHHVGRRLGHRHSWGAPPAPQDLRITRGLGRFAGADFPCQERDAHIGATWSQGACLITCMPVNPVAPRCENARAVCRRHAAEGCRTVDINVEGSVATLKQETELSRRTSWVKDIKVTRGHGEQAIGVDRPCQEANSHLPRLPKGSACILRCPLLDCSRAIELCYETQRCIAVDLVFGSGSPAVARLRYETKLRNEKMTTRQLVNEIRHPRRRT